ncbi:hypothetical protein C4546_03855 [Candidatus Parcubacteria bacterium]|jgi:hypothetical protein|nr:MAG: hypothetical protein C4546_03855 [Candidatus Parcubacteria bacterium]
MKVLDLLTRRLVDAKLSQETQASFEKMIHRVKAFIYFLNAYTLIVWGWLILEFFSKSQIRVPTLASTLYLTLVGAYVGDKEILRMQKKYASRGLRGELFVLLWMFTLIILVALVTLWGNGHGYRLPPDLPIISGTVLCFWLISEGVKSRRQKKR